MPPALDILAWTLAVVCMVAGYIGTILPVLPGTVLIFVGAVGYWAIRGAEGGFGWVGAVVLGLLMLLSLLVDMASTAAGAKWFGSTKWGVIGALVGGIVGFFFSIVGILVGPIIGAVAFELLFAKKEWRPAGKSGLGTVVGGAVGLAVKLGLATAMVGWFFADVLWFERF